MITDVLKCSQKQELTRSSIEIPERSEGIVMYSLANNIRFTRLTTSQEKQKTFWTPKLSPIRTFADCIISFYSCHVSLMAIWNTRLWYDKTSPRKGKRYMGPIYEWLTGWLTDHEWMTDRSSYQSEHPSCAIFLFVLIRSIGYLSIAWVIRLFLRKLRFV